MALERGQVYLLTVDLPQQPVADQAGTHGGFETKKKYFVVLADSNMRDVAGVYASSKKNDKNPRDFEVEVGVADGFQVDTIIDCRWPYTFPVKWVEETGQHTMTLSETTMRYINAALVSGLQMF